MIINAAHLSEIETARPRRYYGRHTHASDAGRGLSVCGRRGVPVQTPGQPVTCGNCRRRLAAQERRDAMDAARQLSDVLDDLDDPMSAAGWRRNRRGEWVPA